MMTGTDNYMAALAVASIQVLKWKAEIAKARFRFDDASNLSAQELQRIQQTHHAHDVRAFVDTEAERIAVETGRCLRPLAPEIPSSE